MQSPVSIGGPTIEDAAHLLRSVAHPLLASLSSHQAELGSASEEPLEAQQAQQAQRAAHTNGNGPHAVADSAHDGGSGITEEADQLQIQVNQTPVHFSVARQGWVSCSLALPVHLLAAASEFACGVA